MFATVPPVPFPPLMIGPLGMQEMLIILVVALIVFGPRKLPQIGKTLGKSIAEFRRTSTELRSTLEREVQMEDFRAARNEVSGLRKDVSNLGRGLDPDAASGPRGENAPDSGSAAAERAAAPAGTAGRKPEDTASGSSASAADASGDGQDSAGSSDPAAGAGDPSPESRQDTGT